MISSCLIVATSVYTDVAAVLACQLIQTVRCHNDVIHIAERCVYYGVHHNLNQTQSHDIRCASRHLLGSTYYHKEHQNTNVSTMENQVDIIYCEASSQRYQHLNLYDEAQGDGTKSLISSGTCLITTSDVGINCTRVMLYINLTYYDQNNGSVIPVCAFDISDGNFNSEFAMHMVRNLPQIFMVWCLSRKDFATNCFFSMSCPRIMSTVTIYASNLLMLENFHFQSIYEIFSHSKLKLTTRRSKSVCLHSLYPWTRLDSLAVAAKHTNHQKNVLL